MKRFYILLLTALCALGASAQDAYYNIPDGAFFRGLNSGAANYPNAYIHMAYDGSKVFKSTVGAGDWYSGATLMKSGAEEYKGGYSTLGASYKIPKLVVEGMNDYIYGNASAGSVFVGVTNMYDMTPARLWCTESQKAGGNARAISSNWLSTAHDTIAEFFYNRNLMYIDKLTIPVTGNNNGYNVDNLFPNGEDSYLLVSIRKATVTYNEDGSVKSKTLGAELCKKKVTKEDFTASSTSSYIGNIGVSLDEPITIDGEFAIQIEHLKSCYFYIYCANYVKNNTCVYFASGPSKGFTTYPGNYMMAISVHAMFPALYKDDASVETIQVAETGEDKQITIHSNVNPAASDFEINGLPDWASVKEITYEGESFSASKKSYVTFTVEANTGAPRMATITLNNRGKEITYTINQKGYSSAVVSSVGWGTVCVPFNLTVSDSYKVYKVTSDGTSITKQLVEKNGENKVVIPINTPVLVNGPALNHKSSTARYCSADIDITEDNSMVGVFQDGFVPYDEEGDYDYYVLQNLPEKSGLGFYKVTQEGIAIKANRAYLKVAKTSSAKDFIGFEDETTGIESIIGDKAADSKVYNLQGVRVNGNYKGIILSKGKKYLKK